MEYEDSVKHNQLQSALKEFGQATIYMERFSVSDSEDNNVLFMTIEDLTLCGLIGGTNRPKVIALHAIAGEGIAEEFTEEEPTIELEIE